MKMGRRETIYLILAILSMLFAAMVAYSKQTQPDAKRLKQIQTALVEHGYPAPAGWPKTQELLRDIARDHGWQTHRAPDARVLILLGLGNDNSNPWVAEQPAGHLDGGE